MKHALRACVAKSTVGVALCVCHSLANAQGFADDFSSNTVNSDFSIYSNWIANIETVASVDDSGVLLNIVHADPTNDERAVYEFTSQRVQSSVRSTGQFVGQRPTVGNVRYESQGRFYNSIADGGLGEDDRTGDVEIELVLRLGTSPEEDRAEVCFKDRDSEGNSQPLEETRNKCENFQMTNLDVNTPYTLEVGIDRSTQELFAELNDERITVSSPTAFYEPNNRYGWARFRVRDGAESAQFRLSSLIFDGEEANLQFLDTQGRYKTDNFDNFSGDDNRSKEVINGRLRMSATVNSSEEDNDAFLRLANPNDYIEADLIYSSESSVDTSGGGFAAVRVGGLLYNDTSDALDVGNLGTVWASVMLIDNADSGLVGEYCVIRSDAADFSESTDLADGMDNDRCPTFELAVSADTIYNASLSLDSEAKTITFKLADEVIVYNITTDVYKRDGLLRAQARMASGATGTVVGYFDNLRNSPTALTDEELLASMNGDSGTDGSSASSSGGGGGCSIVDGQREYSMILLMLAAFMSVFWRKAARRRKL